MNRSIIIALALALLSACYPSTQNPTEMTRPKIKIGMVEITTFTLNPGISIDDFEKSANSE